MGKHLGPSVARVLFWVCGASCILRPLPGRVFVANGKHQASGDSKLQRQNEISTVGKDLALGIWIATSLADTRGGLGALGIGVRGMGARRLL